MSDSVGRAGDDYSSGDMRTVYGLDYVYTKGELNTNDTLVGVAGEQNFLSGGRGDDDLFGAELKDILHGGRGDDNLYGGAGDDRLYGGRDNDDLHGGAGDDKIDGGEGDEDMVIFDKSIENYEISVLEDGTVVVEDLNGDEGEDRIVSVELFNFGGDEVEITDILADYGNGQTSGDNQDADTDTDGGGDGETGTEGVTYAGTDQGDWIVYWDDTTDGSFSAITTSDDDTVDGLEGNDIIAGGQGNDTIDGGDGPLDGVVFSGARSEYDVVSNNDGPVTVTDTIADRDGSDTVSNVEVFMFYNDGAWDQYSLNELLTLDPEGPAPTNLEVFSSDPTDETIDAGDGEVGRAYFDGLLSDYVITDENGDGSQLIFEDTRVNDDAGTPDDSSDDIVNQGTDTFIGAEYFIFGDGSVYTVDELLAAITAEDSA